MQGLFCFFFVYLGHEKSCENTLIEISKPCEVEGFYLLFVQCHIHKAHFRKKKKKGFGMRENDYCVSCLALLRYLPLSLF